MGVELPWHKIVESKVVAFADWLGMRKRTKLIP